MDLILIQALNGLASASSLFLIASGLSIIFGVTRVVNFAHGSLFMLGAYIAWSLVTRFGAGSPAGFWGGVVLAALLVGGIGALIEVLLLRRIYQGPELFHMLATFGVVLAVQDIALAAWGPQDLLGPRAPWLTGAVTVPGGRLPAYELFLILLGPTVLGALWLVFNRTRWGTLVRAATLDREMVGALGVNQRVLFTSVFFLGSCLAGLGGALQLPREAVNLQMDLTSVVEAFVVVVVGGLGSLAGAYLAAVLIGIGHALGILIFPKITLVLVFLIMAAVLIVRPHGLLGRAPSTAAAGAQPSRAPLLAPADAETRLLGGAAGAALLAAPLVIGDYSVTLLTELMILALFAASLHFMMGPGGLASFGHAAYFGIGAYGAALAAKGLGLPMLGGLLLAPLLAAFAGAVLGWFCVRLSGVYLAMLTLAFAQIAWSVAFQWVELTGGDNGILGVWPPAWAAHKVVLYYLALALCGALALGLRALIFAPFGYALRAGRDSAVRAEAIGLNVVRVNWLAFIIAGAGAGAAGGLFAYFKGSVFPTYMSLSKSVDALAMVLLGGVDTVSGPIAGAAAFVWMQDALVRGVADYWRLILGTAIIAVVLVFPQGLAGGVLQLRERWRGEGAGAPAGRAQ